MIFCSSRVQKLYVKSVLEIALTAFVVGMTFYVSESYPILPAFACFLLACFTEVCASYYSYPLNLLHLVFLGVFFVSICTVYVLHMYVLDTSDFLCTYMYAEKSLTY